MRKMSIAPLLLLIAIFVYSHFAKAADLPTTLPAKLPAKQTATLPAKKVVILKKKKRVVVVQAAPGLPTKLPAKTKVTLNFDQPALPPTEGVVIQERTVPVIDEADVQAIQHRELTEAPVIEFVGPEPQQAAVEIPNTAPHMLHQALPDSDSFEVGAPAAPVVVAAPVGAAPVAAPVVAAPVPVTKPAPTYVAMPSAGPAPAKSLPVYVEPVTVAEAPAPVAPPIVEEQTAAPQLVVATPVEQTVSATTLPPELMGPPAPPVLDTVSQRTDVSVSEAAIDAEKGAHAEGYTIHSGAAVQTTFLIPHDEIPQRRVFIRGGYLDAAYSKLESDLRNGATTFGVSVSQVFSKTEVRLGIDVAHGLDQSITLRNTRMAMFRAEGLYDLAKASDIADFYIGGALGIADIDVTSFRGQTSNGDTTIRENAKGDSLLAAPEIGTRLHIGRQISFDITAQYLFLTGGDPVSSLGGLLGEAALGFTF